MIAPVIASALFAFGILGLFFLNRDSSVRTSVALWIPVIWLFIAGSRPVSMWVGGRVEVGPSTQVMMEGSPLDRNVFIVLLLLGIIALLARSKQAGNLLRNNGALLLFVLYCALSILWSDYPDVAFKRWIKLLGDFVMVAVVVTESDPLGATKRLLARTGFVLLPLSILFIKYYPQLGRGYNPWDGAQHFTGVADNKNSLGTISLVFGLAALWQFLEVSRGGRKNGRGRQMVAQGVVACMAIWLLWTSNSMTSLSCFVMGLILILAAKFLDPARKSWIFHALVALILVISVSTLFLDVGGDILGSMGRDPSLTGRTAIWNLVLGMKTSPLIGTGFESFWLGNRLQRMWSIYWWHPIQAHNGYLEIYLSLGWVGVTVLALALLSGYRRVMDTLRKDPVMGGLMLGYFVVAVAYNFTESAIKPVSPTWITLLLAITTVPRISGRQEPARRELDAVKASGPRDNQLVAVETS